MKRVDEVVFEDAIRLVSRRQFVSCSFLQSQLSVGYADAQAILARLRDSNRIVSARPRLTFAEIAKEWAGEYASIIGEIQSVQAPFFGVTTGVAFSSTDLYCALLSSEDADNLSVAYGIARADGPQRANTVAMTILNSIGHDTHTYPADGLVLKITSDPLRLLGHEIRQIGLALRAHTTERCVIAVAIQYDALGEELVLEAIASKIKAR